MQWLAVAALTMLMPIDVRSAASCIHSSEPYEVKPRRPRASSFGVRSSACLVMQAGKPWSHPWIQAGVSGSAFFLAGEAGIRLEWEFWDPEELRVSATMSNMGEG